MCESRANAVRFDRHTVVVGQSKTVNSVLFDHGEHTECHLPPGGYRNRWSRDHDYVLSSTIRRVFTSLHKVLVHIVDIGKHHRAGRSI